MGILLKDYFLKLIMTDEIQWVYKVKFELNCVGGGGGIQPSDKFRLTFQKYSVLVQESEPVLQNV